MQFQVGQDVTWLSQAQGSATRKEGTVAQIVAAGAKPNIQGLSRKHGARSAYGGGMARDHESYVVLVPGGKTDKAKPVLYWPRAAALTLLTAR